jgi:hypothetical protein
MAKKTSSPDGEELKALDEELIQRLKNRGIFGARLTAAASVARWYGKKRSVLDDARVVSLLEEVRDNQRKINAALIERFEATKSAAAGGK